MERDEQNATYARNLFSWGLSAEASDMIADLDQRVREIQRYLNAANAEQKPFPAAIEGDHD